MCYIITFFSDTNHLTTKYYVSILDQQQQINQILSQQPLTARQIKVLSPHSKQYAIPHNQLYSKVYGAVLFNAYNRDGGVAEADNFENALEKIASIVFKMEWADASELRRMIHCITSRVVDDCSLLVVSVMSHGIRGVVKGSDDSVMPINDILKQLTDSLPNHIPLVVKFYKCFSTVSLTP